MYIDFITPLHKKTKRDYLGRVTGYPKAEAAKKARLFEYDYWDGDRNICYGGYYYDGRHKPVAEAMIRHYNLTNDSVILDMGCGKGFLLYEFTQLLPGITVVGFDISQYALKNCKEEVKGDLIRGSADFLPFKSNSFDLVISITTLHNLYCYQMASALKEIERVSRDHAYIVVESYRNEEEKVNLLYWQVTCEGFYTPEEWVWWFDQTGYTGDYSFIYFE
ncbi:class I SAM-dependent methyltransferase [Methanospirillum sp.]|uniref:class I SAM-dependent methyltransferase n=1 Tax=Methanospirillum sp. TaxID=45200 RepID=UPI0035A1D210